MFPLYCPYFSVFNVDDTTFNVDDTTEDRIGITSTTWHSTQQYGNHQNEPVGKTPRPVALTESFKVSVWQIKKMRKGEADRHRYR